MAAPDRHEAQAQQPPLNSLHQRLVACGSRQESLVADCRRFATTDIPEEGFPGWGQVLVCRDTVAVSEDEAPKAHLGELTSTAICGNDITGSCFYVIGALAAAAGVWAPFGAVIAAGTLWLFRWIYTEAVSALPFNGGIYNVLLNTVHSKKIAGLVATLTMLSYLATCVVSAISAGAYLQTIIDPAKKDPMEEGCYILPVSILLVVFFAILKLIGISESATVAAGMFVIHLGTMAVLMGSTLLSIAVPTTGLPFSQVMSNLRTNFNYSGKGVGFDKKIMLGFSNAMLGVSGFETSANFIEEQREGVFTKTLRNMWYAVTVLNVGFIIECLAATELDKLVKEKDNALAYLGRMAAGRWLEVWVSVDAFMILAAAVLTSYVGIGGLISRMSGDRCVPQIFNRSDRVTTVLFMVICISLILLLKADTAKLAAVYSFAFLSVMLLFALSVVVLQIQRPKLPRDMKNNVLIPAAAAVLVIVALSGAVFSNDDVIPIFLVYWLILLLCVGSFMFRLQIFQQLQKLLGLFTYCPKRFSQNLSLGVQRILEDSSVVYFSKTANLCRLNKAIQYILQNEDTNYCRIVHIFDEEAAIPHRLVPFCQILDSIYPSVRIDVVLMRGTFGPQMISHLSQAWGVPCNLMFITCPTSTEAGRRLQDLRGVRVIMGHEEEEMLERESWERGVSPELKLESLFSHQAEGQEQLVSRLLSQGHARAFSFDGSPAAARSSQEAELPNARSWPLAACAARSG